MSKQLMDYIDDYYDCHYADMADFFKDLRGNSPEFNEKILVELLLYIEMEEMKEEKKE